VVAFCAHSVLLVFAAESLGFHNFVFASIADLHCFWHHIAQDIYVIVKGTSCCSGLFIPRFFLFFCCGVLAANAMSYSPRRRHSSPAPQYRSRTRSRSPTRSYRETSEDANNPGNNLYVTGLSVRVSEKELQDHFEREGKVLECRLVVDPRTRESRGFGFVTMSSAREADRCIKYLHRSTLEGRVITVEKVSKVSEEIACKQFWFS
jgi:hypothetical protein